MDVNGEFATQSFQFFHQFQCQCDTRKVDLQVTLQAQRRAGASQRRPGKAPFRGVDLDNGEDAFFHQFDDVRPVDRTQPAQFVDAEHGIFLVDLSGQQTFLEGLMAAYTPSAARGLNGIASDSAR